MRSNKESKFGRVGKVHHISRCPRHIEWKEAFFLMIILNTDFQVSTFVVS